MKYPISRLRTKQSQAGFSLVEVTLAVGIMAFSLVGILGVLPLAMNSGRQSFNQARASAVANTLFATIRDQPFDNVRYLDCQYPDGGSVDGPPPPKIDLNLVGAATGAGTATGKVQPEATFYARFLDAPSDQSPNGDGLGDVRRVCFTSDIPKESAGNFYPGELYLIQLYFNNAPEGTIVPPTAAPSSSSTNSSRAGQANRITAVVSASSYGEKMARERNPELPLRDPYRFVTTVANRLN